MSAATDAEKTYLAISSEVHDLALGAWNGGGSACAPAGSTQIVYWPTVVKLAD
ncbi:hypothetical protein [Nocardia altamirensis]|uniref:hypothetical protein n=1 Tax=Nocardia altamirensis TaxID=472158 RepID=UPI0014356574|nr:hypothetical protein [Nocardia altamirensis]